MINGTHFISIPFNQYRALVLQNACKILQVTILRASGWKSIKIFHVHFLRFAMKNNMKHFVIWPIFLIRDATSDLKAFPKAEVAQSAPSWPKEMYSYPVDQMAFGWPWMGSVLSTVRFRWLGISHGPGTWLVGNANTCSRSDFEKIK